MAEHPSRLGRGLGALLAPRPPHPPGGDTEKYPHLTDGDPAPTVGAIEASAQTSFGELAGASYREVPVDTLRANPRQPRTVFDEDALAELAASIAQVGLLQPIVVREVSAGAYEIVMGERRWRAAVAAGLDTVPVLVRDTAPEALLRDALLENLHRADLNPLDEAAAYSQLLSDFGVTHEQLAGRLGRSRAHVSNTMRLLQLPPAVQRRVAAGVLSAGHARAILALADSDAQERLAARVSAEGLSVRAVEEIVAVGGEVSAPRRAVRARPARREYAELAEALTDRWETRVRVQAGRHRGRLVVEFGSEADLDRLLGIVAPDVRQLLGDDRTDDGADDRTDGGADSWAGSSTDDPSVDGADSGADSWAGPED